RTEGHGDLVGEYLDRAMGDPLVSAAFKERIPVLRVEALVDQAQALDQPSARADALRRIEPDLRKLAADNAEAKRLLTDVTDRVAVAAADEARRMAMDAERHPVASERAERRKAARAALDDAREKLAAAEALIVAERERL